MDVKMNLGIESTVKTFSDPDSSTKTHTNFHFRPISPSSFIAPSKNNTKTQSTVRSNRKSSDGPCFFFGKGKREPHHNSPKGFNFVFNDISPNAESAEANTEFKIPTPPIFNFKTDGDTAIFKDKSDNSNRLPNFNKYEETRTNLKDEQTNGKVENIDRKNHEESNGKDKIEETISIRTLFNEFRGIVNEFVKERIEYEKRILALEERVEVLEKKCQTKGKHEPNISSVPLVDGMSSMSLNTTTPANFSLGATTFLNAANQSSLSNQSFKSCPRISDSSSIQDSSVLSDDANSPVFEVSAPVNTQNGGPSTLSQQGATNTGDPVGIKDGRIGDSGLSDISATIMKSLKLDDLKEVLESSIRQAIENNISKMESSMRH
ncbi:hypothetical protein QAD02_015401 [Eretmocerus hayati]|uniref:Uncharacterized protein n=1 Tax=Eretmocerus hayati TaxID=131215 RepID=A0ACC2P7R5_9HYME|nr:hypothetical protein QAD02_015401 [Eretmocerus hayati]